MNKHVKAVGNTIVSVCKGLQITWRNMVRTKTTQRYPEVMPTPVGQTPRPQGGDTFAYPSEIAPRFRGLHGLTKDPETGDLNCIGCLACAKVCPDDLISMDLEKREGHNGRFPVTFTVNIGPCCFCGLCAEVCPTPMRAIVMTDLFEWATFQRDGLNLVLTAEDLIRNGDYEVERRRRGRQWSEDGALVGVNPEEEGNPYFQFAPESGKADRMPKRTEERVAPAAPLPAATVAAPATPAADPLAGLRTAFEAAGVAVPDDGASFDASVLDGIEDRKLRGSCKSALAKARRAAEAPAAEAAAGRPAGNADESGSDPLSPRERDGVKAAAEAPTGPPTLTPTLSRGEREAELAHPAHAEAPADDADALRAALVEALAAAEVDVPDPPESVATGVLDGIGDRKLRGQAKSALRKLQRALGLVE
ncbi:MAG: NADH-quinone oxidoreductase subunit I [Armatimonadetes bacterium]|nr:NADH-quinone oxidoreductase subunit I [Armatimonadota bacterium]